MRIYNGDCLNILKSLVDNSVDAVITDPPYGISFMGKKWDYDVPSVDIWKECLRVLKPGGHLLSFAGTRTYHRIATNIEDAGFDIRDMIEWVYGSGFPKSLNIGKAMDGILGKQGKGFRSAGDDGRKAEFKQDLSKRSDYGYKFKPQSENAKQWEGWGTALKPAHEPICMARKPLSEKTVAKNCLKWGTGGINIDESRVEANDKSKFPVGIVSETENTFGGGKGLYENRPRPEDTNPNGRFPANLIHDNSEEVRECFPNKSERFFKSIIYQAKASKKDRGEGNNHATVKPTALMEYLIKMVTREEQTVLDPFMGSGSTGVACNNANRKFIGIEIDEDYFKIANKRLE